jgi:hypothetical protein
MLEWQTFPLKGGKMAYLQQAGRMVLLQDPEPQLPRPDPDPDPLTPVHWFGKHLNAEVRHSG